MEEIYTAIGTIITIVFGALVYLYFFKPRNHKKLPLTPLKSISKTELAKYPEITNLSRKITKGTSNRSNRRTEDTRMIHSIVLLTPSHRKKIIIENHEDSGVAVERLKILAKELNKKIVKYNPKISNQTRNRRR